MKTIGDFLKEARNQRQVTFGWLEEKTRIKSDFLRSLEKNEWHKLPEYPIVSGFVRNIAKVLEEDEKKASALLRRDYPPKTLSINPKPDIGSKFSWNPRLAFLTGVLLVIIGISTYLVVQFINYRKPPKLFVGSPADMAVIESPLLKVEGTTEVDSTLIVNNQPVIIADDGRFETEIELVEGENKIIVKSRTRLGKETEDKRKVFYEPDGL